MPYPKDSYIEIRYNQSQIGPVDNAMDDVQCSSNLQLEVACDLNQQDKITMTGMFAEDTVENTYMWFVVSGLFIDLLLPTDVEPFTSW